MPTENCGCPRILLVEDEQVMHMVFQELFKGQEYHLDCCLDGEEALRRLKAEPYDLLIADKNLPGISGLQVIAEGRKMRPSMECIMITAYPTEQSMLLALQKLGVRDYIPKPFSNVLILRERVKEALSHHPFFMGAAPTSGVSCAPEPQRKVHRESHGSLEHHDPFGNQLVEQRVLSLQHENAALRETLRGVKDRLIEGQARLSSAGQTPEACPEVHQVLETALQAIDHKLKPI